MCVVSKGKIGAFLLYLGKVIPEHIPGGIRRRVE